MGSRNIELTLLKALGILAVVSCHIGINIFNIMGLPLSIKGELFPEYSYHMPLFIFASGYFYKTIYETNIKSLIIKRVKMLVDYTKCNVFYFVLCFILIGMGLLNREVDFTLRSLFIEPFLGGFQFYFNGPAWFVPFIFLVQVIYTLIRSLVNNIVEYDKYVDSVFLVVLMLLGVLSAYMCNLSPVLEDKVTLFHSLMRLLYGLQFYALGYYYRTYVESKLGMSLNTFLIVVFSKVIVHIMFNYYSFSLRIVQFNGYSLLPLTVSILGILYCLHLVKFIVYIDSKFKLKLVSLLRIVGENTWSIMMHHLLVKWSLSKIYMLPIIPNWLASVGSYFISPILCVVLPILFSMYYKKFSSKVKLEYVK